MFDFMDAVKKELDNMKQCTENGAIGYATTGKHLLDMHFKVSSYRDVEENEILSDFVKAYAENPELALKWVFYVGDIREGLGERRLFRILIKYVLVNHSNLIPYVGEYNRFDSLMELFDTPVEKEMISFVMKQLADDMIAYDEGKNISLLAKWLPSVNTSSKATRFKAYKLIKALNLSPREYRKMLSKLRNALDVIEVKACSRQWDKIDYTKVPSKANLKYAQAFLKHDFSRRTEFFKQLELGEAKINSGVCFPHDIYTNYRRLKNYDETLENMWKALPDFENAVPTIVVRDGSGSMITRVDSKSNALAWDVASALTLYYAERLNGPFKNKFITFSSHPEYVDISKCKTLRSKYELLKSYNECSNTNIEATFDLLLDVAVKNKLKQEEIPQILIVSDMEFDYALSNSYIAVTTEEEKTLFENIASKWNAAGYKMPRLVFWNVCSRTKTIPLKENEAGVALVSGFSANNTKMIMSNETVPYKLLLNTLMSKRYEVIK